MYEIRICRNYTLFENSLHYSTEVMNRKNIIKKTSERNVVDIACCTMVTSGYKDLLKLWLDYNIFIGVKHFYIYDHAPQHDSHLRVDLKAYVEKRVVTIIPWHYEFWFGFKFHTSDWIKHQVWSQNDCIKRYGNKHKWMGIFDIDEFPVPLQNKTLLNILNQVPSKHCSLLMNHCFSGGNEKFNRTLAIEPSNLVDFVQRHIFPKNNCVKRPKQFVRPSQIYYYAVHEVTVAVNQSQVYLANDTHEMLLHHYKANFPRWMKSTSV